MNFNNIEEIERQGFSGFVTVSALQESACRQVPDSPGIYLVIRTNPTPPVFLSHSIGGHFKGREPAVSIQELQHAWVSQSAVIYIGKAAALRKRLRGYMRFGEGEPAHHWGGRYIWQLADAKSLLVCWRVLSDEAPAHVESQLIREFKANYGTRPFANLRD